MNLSHSAVVFHELHFHCPWSFVTDTIDIESSSFQHEFEVDIEQKDLLKNVKESQKSKSDSTVWNAKVNVTSTFLFLYPWKLYHISFYGHPLNDNNDFSFHPSVSSTSSIGAIMPILKNAI